MFFNWAVAFRSDGFVWAGTAAIASGVSSAKRNKRFSAGVSAMASSSHHHKVAVRSSSVQRSSSVSKTVQKVSLPRCGDRGGL